MNKRQAKKRRKKQALRFLDNPEFIDKIVKTLGDIFSRWLEEGMPFPKGESEEQDE